MSKKITITEKMVIDLERAVFQRVVEKFQSGKPAEVYTDMMDAVTMALLEVAENPSEAEELIKLWRRDQ